MKSNAEAMQKAMQDIREVQQVKNVMQKQCNKQDDVLKNRIRLKK